jgi:hypothetical protein
LLLLNAANPDPFLTLARWSQERFWGIDASEYDSRLANLFVRAISSVLAGVVVVALISSDL